jgi:hypothetical protein
VRPSPASDPQRNEVYAWERKFDQLFLDHAMPYRKAHKLAAAMAAAYGVRKPRLSWRRARKERWIAAAWGDEMVEVNTTKADFTAALVAHEMAHVITHAYGILEPDHGPTWMGVYLWLLDHFKVVPKCASEPSARKAGLKFKRNVGPGQL